MSINDQAISIPIFLNQYFNKLLGLFYILSKLHSDKNKNYLSTFLLISLMILVKAVNDYDLRMDGNII